jgi:hypothetical protein
MVAICVIHNNEVDRLQYLKPQLDSLLGNLRTTCLVPTLHYVGSDIDVLNQRIPKSTPKNRFLRAFWLSAILDRDYQLDPPTDKPRLRSRARQFVKNLRSYFFGYHRSLRAEQELLHKHLHAWRIAVAETGTTFVLESDVRFRPNAIQKLSSLAAEFETAERPVYIDLAGGCDIRGILRSWCFDENRGGLPCEIAGIRMIRLPAFANNTSCAYMITPATARRFCSLKLPMLGVDWSMMAWALWGFLDEVECLHSFPSLLEHGSMSGAYSTQWSQRGGDI